MEIVSCASCARPQPVDWKPGDVCVHCGAVARPESRCPWCTRLGPGRFCRHCGCEQVAPADYGVARMLFAAGVDQLSLGERLRKLDPAQRDVFASRFASQRACVAARVEEARACEQCLVTKGVAAVLEEALVSALPVPERTSWLQPGNGVLPSFAELFATSSLVELQELAALAHLRSGAVDEAALRFARQLAESDGPLAVEAALIVSGWRTRAVLRLGSSRGRDGRREKLEAALGEPAFSAEAAVCLALDGLGDRWSGRWDSEGLEALLPKVREGLGAANPDIQFGAALVLGDEARLSQALASRDEAVREAALRALARVGSPQVPGLLHGPDAEVRAQLLEMLSTPLPTPILAAVLRLIDGEDTPVRARALRLVQRERFGALPPGSREELVLWLMTHGEALHAKEALELLDWAATATDGQRPPPEALRPFVDVATRALRLAPPDAEAFPNGALAPWLRELRTEEDLLALDRLVAAPATSKRVLEELLILGSRDPDVVPEGVALGLLLAVWDRAGAAREGWLPTFARVLRDHRGLRGVDALVRAFWDRFRERVAERAQIVRALEAFKRELFELRDQAPADPALDGGDPVRFFELWTQAAPRALRETFEAALTRGQGGALLPLTQAALPVALAAVEARPKTALLLLARISQEVCNAFRAARTPQTWAAVSALREAWAAFEPKLAQASPVEAEETGFDYLLRHVQDELEIIDRHEREQAEREAEQAERERQRAAERAKREREAAERKAEGERQAAVAQAARDRLMAERQAAEAARLKRLASIQAAASPGSAVGEAPHLEPDLPAIPLDDEPMGIAPLSTLRDYVRFMKLLSSTGDVMLLFEAYGMDPPRWADCANGWQRVLMSRQDAMLRFGALLQATWAPTL